MTSRDAEPTAKAAKVALFRGQAAGNKAARRHARALINGVPRDFDVDGLSSRQIVSAIEEAQTRDDARRGRIEELQALRGVRVGDWTIAGATIRYRGTDVDLYVVATVEQQKVRVHVIRPDVALLPTNDEVVELVRLATAERSLGDDAALAAEVMARMRP